VQVGAGPALAKALGNRCRQVSGVWRSQADQAWTPGARRKEEKIPEAGLLKQALQASGGEEGVVVAGAVEVVRFRGLGGEEGGVRGSKEDHPSWRATAPQGLQKLLWGGDVLQNLGGQQAVKVAQGLGLFLQ
jgi:hypothetical protein